MRDELLPAFETFLVEDVILTLGNLRGSLAWLGQSDAGADPGLHRAGLARLDRQIETLEDRARAVCRIIRDAPAAAGTPPAAAAYAPAISLERLLQDALGSEAKPRRGDAGRPEFRSRRTALR